MFQNSGREGPHQTIASKIQTEGPVGECPGSDVSHSTMRGLVRKMIGPVFPVAAGWIPRTTYAGHEDVRYQFRRRVVDLPRESLGKKARCHRGPANGQRKRARRAKSPAKRARRAMSPAVYVSEVPAVFLQRHTPNVPRQKIAGRRCACWKRRQGKYKRHRQTEGGELRHSARC